MVKTETNQSQTNTPTIPEKSNYKLNLALNSEAKQELEWLKAKTHKSTLVDVLRAALVVYKLIIDHQLSGGRVVFRHADDKEETLRIV